MSTETEKVSSEEVAETEDVKDEASEKDVESADEVEEEIEEEVGETEEVAEDSTTSNRENERIRELVAERNAWRDLAQETSRQPSRKQQEEEILPELDPELEAAVEARVSRKTKQLETYIGKTLEEFDEFKASSKIPDYEKVSNAIDSYRTRAYRNGQFFNRIQAYNQMVAEGLIKRPVETKKRTVIKKSNPKFASERKNAQATDRGKPASKDFSKLSLKEKEEKLKDVTF